MGAIREKSVIITSYLEERVTKRLGEYARIITPREISHRGAQLSLDFNVPMHTVQQALFTLGVIVDVREPSAMRIAPAPLYNSFDDVLQVVLLLQKVLSNIQK